MESRDSITIMMSIRDYIHKDNQDCLVVYNVLRKGFDEICRRHDPCLNLISIFFADLMDIITHYILLRNEVDNLSGSVDFRSFAPVNNFPYYIGYDDVLNGIDFEHKHYEKVAMGSIKSRSAGRLMNAAMRLRRQPSLTIGVFPGMHCMGRFRCKFLLEVPAISVPDFKAQLEIVFRCIDEIWQMLALSVPAENMKQLFKRHIALYVKENTENPRFDIDVLVSRKTTLISERIVAALCCVQHIPVVNIFHGEGFGLLDDPIDSYGLKVNADAVLGYGPFFVETPTDFPLSQFLYKKPYYICADSDIVRRLYKGPEVSLVSSLDDKRIMYVPTSFSGARFRIGPYRDMPDSFYLRWHEQLIAQFPSLIWKGHVKEKARRDLMPSNAKMLTRRRFEKCLDAADIFFFDYVSSAFFIACATDKPIVFFDIGIRNITPRAYELIKRRCIIVKVNLDSVGDLKEEIRAQLRDPRVNEIAPRCSLGLDNRKGRFETLYEWIAQNVKVKQ